MLATNDNLEVNFNIYLNPAKEKIVIKSDQKISRITNYNMLEKNNIFIKKLKPLAMKKLFTLLLLLSTVTLFAQQIDRQKVVVEVGTGTWCPSCPAVVEILHDFVDQGLEIAIVEYHNNDNYTNAASILRENYYDISWFPTTLYDANLISIGDWATPSVHLQYYQDRMNTPTSFTAAINGEVVDDALSGYVTLDKVAEYTGENLVLHVVVTESNIPENWQGETELDHVERAMFPDGNGTAIDFSSSDQLVVDFNFDLDPEWAKENCEITYFIQDNDTKEILQGDFVNLDELTILNIGDNSQVNNAYFYPNPATDQLHLSAINTQAVKNIEIFDLLGKKIVSHNSYTTAINISNLPQGVYLLSFYENDVKKVSKIIKQ